MIKKLIELGAECNIEYCLLLAYMITVMYDTHQSPKNFSKSKLHYNTAINVMRAVHLQGDHSAVLIAFSDFSTYF